MARLREFDEQKALKAVKELFWRRGFEGTSYADLQKATGLGKGSLYAAFGDKRALYLKALQAYIDSEVDAAVALLQGGGAGRPRPGLRRVQGFLDLVIEAVARRGDRRGCFLCNAAVELAPEDAEVEAAVIAGLDRMRRALDRALDGLTPPRRRKAAVEKVISVYFGLRVLAKAGTPVPQLRLARDAALTALAPAARG